jgi:hypothetical protein
MPVAMLQEDGCDHEVRSPILPRHPYRTISTQVNGRSLIDWGAGQQGWTLGRVNSTAITKERGNNRGTVR